MQTTIEPMELLKDIYKRKKKKKERKGKENHGELYSS